MSSTENDRWVRPGSVKERSRCGSLPVAVEVEELEHEAVELEVDRRHPHRRRRPAAAVEAGASGTFRSRWWVKPSAPS